MRISDANYHLLKRLHSLTGVVPIGLFLLVHFFTNSKAVQGPDLFDHAAGELASVPYIVLVEALGIWLPILFHMVLGIVIATTAQATGTVKENPRYWQYLLQRGTGIFLVAFIVYHTWATRFSGEYLHSASAYQYMREHLSHPGVFAFYAVGIASACYHFGNGLFGFAIHWGIVTGVRAQRQVARLGLAAGLVLTLVGFNALLGFLGHGVNLFQKPHAAPHDVVVVTGGPR